MPNEILIKSGTPIVWANTTDYAGDGGTRTHQIDLTSLADGAARQGAKADLGATRANQFAITVCAEIALAAVSGKSVDIYWATSLSGTAGTANPGGCSGADAAYTGTAGDSLDDSITQLQYIGPISLTSDADPVLQIQTFTLFPQHRYGMPVIKNSSGQAFHSDAIEMYVSATPITTEIQ